MERRDARPVRLTDVARAAGVSVTTASHSFSARRPVAAHTRRRVLRAASELGFTTSPGDQLVAVLLRPPEVLPGFAFGTASFANLAGAISVACLRRGLMVVTAQEPEDLEGTVPRPDGCMIVHPNYEDRALHALVERGIPTVAYDPDPGAASFRWWLGVNYYESVRAVVQHMVDSGLERICVLVGQTDNTYRRSILAAYRSVIDAGPGGPLVRMADNDQGQRAAKAVVRELLAGRRPPDGIVTSSSVFAVGALTTALQMGVRVPDELKLATCMDGPLAEFAPVPITALRPDANRAAERLVEMLQTRIRGGEAPATNPMVNLDLVRRRST